jgi:acyl-CoA thioester hydrolase
MTTCPSHLSLVHAVQPEFYDVDPMGVVWHGNYVRFFESARAALFNQLNYGYEAMKASGYAWPVVDLRVKYVASAFYHQALSVHTSITEWENRLRVDYKIIDSNTGQKLTTGHTIQVAVDLSTQAMCFVSPPILLERLRVAP